MNEACLQEDTLMRVLVIGLSQDLPLTPSDALDIADRLVARAASSHSNGNYTYAHVEGMMNTTELNVFPLPSPSPPLSSHPPYSPPPLLPSPLLSFPYSPILLPSSHPPIPHPPIPLLSLSLPAPKCSPNCRVWSGWS